MLNGTLFDDGSAFVRLQLLLFESQKKKKHRKTASYVGKLNSGDRVRLGWCCVELPYGNILGDELWNQFPAQLS